MDLFLRPAESHALVGFHQRAFDQRRLGSHGGEHFAVTGLRQAALISVSAARAQEQKSRSFKQGQRFRAGIEGTISVLMRGRGMNRCRLSGCQRFEMFVGAAVLAINLMRLAALLTGRKRRPPNFMAA